jgi:hypothetical protein
MRAPGDVPVLDADNDALEVSADCLPCRLWDAHCESPAATQV